MNDQFKKSLENFKQFWANTSKKAKILILAILAAVVIIALGASILLNTKEYVVIFEDLSASESSEIFAALADTEYDVKQDSNGDILCLSKDESAVRMKLATAGYPKSGLSYYLIQDNSSMLSTDYERKQYRNMQLQERIGASIETLEGVKQAVVTITPEEENVFYLQEKSEPSASVIVHMKDGYTLTEAQVNGILNLVSKAVNGLKKENIALTDGQGNELYSDSSNSAETAKTKLTKEIEDQIKKKVTSVLTGPYDPTQFKVSVTATVNTDELVRETVTYNPSPDGDNSGVIDSESHTTESFSSTEDDGGVPGTSTNSDVATYPIGGNGGESTSSASSDEYDYLVSSVKEQMQKSGAVIEDVSIGIAVDKTSFDPGEEASIIELVSYSAGVPEEDVTVKNFKFYKDETPTEEIPESNKKLLFIAIGAAVLLLAAILVLILALRARKKKEAEALAELEARQTLAATNASNKETEEEISKLAPILDARREEVKEFAMNNPEIAAQMIRTWLRNENE